MLTKIKNVPFWTAGIALLVFSGSAMASTNLLWHEGGYSDDSEIEAEQIITPRSLATHLGLTAEDAVFTPPRQFRSKSFNEDRLELEPLRPEDADGA